MTAPYDERARMLAIDRRRSDTRHPHDHERLADDALLALWEIVEEAPDANDAELHEMRSCWFAAIDTYRAERHRGGHRRRQNGRGGLERDPDEPEMPDALRAAFGLAVTAGP